MTDLALSQRLERTEGSAGRDFVLAHARTHPEVGAEWIEVAGAYAMFDGPASPATQTFGLGLFQAPEEADMGRIEVFYRDHHAPVFHEVSPLADKCMLDLLERRGYHPVELTNVLFSRLDHRTQVAPDVNPAIRIRAVGANEVEMWAKTAAEGWRELTEYAGFMTDLMWVVSAKEHTANFLAEWDGQPIAAGSISLHEGVALLAGASTIPEWRKRGAQRALLDARLNYAAQIGCELAMICAEPGGASQRNAEREGFQIAYTRIKWKLRESW